MRLSDKNILLISPEPWDHIFVSKHHYAAHLAKRGNVVLFLNPPSNRNSVSNTDYENVYTVEYTGFPKGLRFYPRYFQQYFIRKKFEKLQMLCNAKFNIVWSFDNSVFFDFSALPPTVVKIFHMVDYNQDFQLPLASETSDYCFCTSESIKKKLENYSTRVFKIQHGYNVPSEINPVKFPGKNPVKALYAGNLEIPYIDWHLIQELVTTNNTVDFIFIGPGSNQNSINKLKGLPNCFFYGKVSAVELQNYYASADILLIAYRESLQLTQLTNPHKMMEYLGSGKMIVATFTAEFEDYAEEGLFLMSKMNSEFSELFKKAILNIDYWNKLELQSRRKDFATSNTYDSQIHRIEGIINDL